MARKPKINLRQFRSDISKLKKAGLTRVDARRAQPTKYLRSLVSKNRDVIRGTAVTVKIKGAHKRIASDIQTRKLISKAKVIASEHKIRTKSGRVIIPATGRPIRYSEKRQQFETTITRDGREVRAILVPRDGELRVLQRQGFTFRIPFARSRGQVDFMTFDEVDTMLAFMHKYEVRREGRKSSYDDWRDHMLITREE